MRKSISVHILHSIVMVNETICIYKQSLYCNFQDSSNEGPGVKDKTKQKQQTFMHLNFEMLPLEHLPILHGLGSRCGVNSLSGRALHYCQPLTPEKE